MFQVEGMADVTAPVTDLGGGRFSATLPTFDLFIGGGPGGGPHVKLAKIVTFGGSTVCVIDQTFQATTTGFALDGPPVSPPAEPVAKEAHKKIPGIGVVVKKNPGTSAHRLSGGGPPIGASALKTRTKSNQTNERILTGETGLGLCPISLETPAGPPLDLVLSYRSMIQSASCRSLSKGWDHAYHVVAQPLHDDPLQPTVLTRIVLYKGDGSVDVLQVAADGSFSANGLSVRGVVSVSQALTLTFANHGRWVFNPFDASASSGTLSQIIDPNGVALSCVYTPNGDIASVSSQFGQSLNFSYDGNGKLGSVSDHTGRVVSFSYFSGEAGGSAGDLKSVSCPVIPGQSAVQGPTTFSYSTGQSDPNLNGNLLTARDGAGRLVCEWTHSSSTDFRSASYDRCETINENGTPQVCSYEFVPFNGGSFSGGLRCIVNDELGRVTEAVFDHNYCPVSEQCFTTFATPGVPVTSSDNRPPAPPVGEPAFLQTTWTWNQHLCCSVCTEPDGTSTRTTFQSDLKRDCPAAERFNECVVSIACKDNSQPPRTVAMEYLPGFGSCDRLLLPAVKRRGEGGDWVWIDVPCPKRVIKGGRSPGENYVSRIAGGSIGAPQPKPDFTYRYPVHSHMAGDFRTRLSTTHGQTFTWSYDANGNCLSSSKPVGGGEVCTYNALGQVTSITTLNGANPNYRDVCEYDPVTQFCSSVVCDRQENGSGLNLTTSFHRNALGLCDSVTDPRGFSTLISYNACDQATTVSSPPLGTTPTRVVSTQFYDLGGLPVRCDVEHRDATGALVSANPAYTGFCVYDERGLLIQETTEQKPVDCPVGVASPDGLGLANFEVCNYTLDACGQVTRCSVPAVCRGQSSDAVRDFQYNALGLCSAVIEGGVGNADAVTTEFSYNSSFQCSKSVCVAVAPGENPTTTCDYDTWGRPSSITDPMGNVTTYTYNDFTGYVTESVYGETTDVPGIAGNVLLSQVSYKIGHPSLIKQRGDDASGKLKRPGRPVYGNITFECAIRGKVKDIKIAPMGRLIGDSSAGDDEGGPVSWAYHAINEKGLPGTKTPKPKGGSTHRIIPTTSGHAINTKGMGCNDRMAAPGGDPYFDIFATDDIVIAERFDPLGQGSEGTETLTIHRTPVGEISSVSNNGDLLAEYGYDTAGRCVSLDLPTVEKRTDTLDACGNPTESVLLCRSTIPGTPDETFTFKNTFDGCGREKMKSDCVDNIDSFEYDSMDRCVSHTRPNGLVIHCDYDTVSPTTGFSSVRQWCDYNNDNVQDQIFSSVILSGECVSTADPLGYTTTYTIDSLGRCVRSDYPDGTFETCVFDSLGRATTCSRKNGAVIACDFDLNDRCVSRVISNLPPNVMSVPATSFHFDGLNRCVLVDDNNSAVTRFYDSLGNVIEGDVVHDYNHRGLLSTTYGDGTKFHYNRDAYGRVLSFNSVVNNVVQQPAISVCDYSGFQCVKEARADGVTTTFDYRSDGEAQLTLPNGVADFSFGECVRSVVTNSSNVIIGNYITRRNRDGEVVQVQSAFGSGQPQRRITFTRDNRDLITSCLTQVRENASLPFSVESEVSYQLDSRGKRTSTSGGRNPGAYASTAGGGLNPFDLEMARYSTWPGGALRWNNEGSLEVLNRGNDTSATSFTYDALDRLVSSDTRDLTGLGTPVVTTYTYDAIGRRSSSTAQGPAPATTYFRYDGDTCYQELDETFNPVMTYSVCDGEQLAITAGSSLYYCHEIPPPRDPGSGLPTGRSLITNSAGAVVERFDCDDAGFPIFLNETGLVRSGATTSLIGYRWFNGDGSWCPESSLFAGTNNVYCPDLKQTISKQSMTRNVLAN